MAADMSYESSNNKLSGSVEDEKFFWPADQLLASQEGLCFMKLTEGFVRWLAF
jgi:hypothetical protein